MTSVGTLLAFILVSAGVWVMRRTHPELIGRSGRRWCRWCLFLSILFSGALIVFLSPAPQDSAGGLAGDRAGHFTSATDGKHSKVQQALQSEPVSKSVVLGIFSLAV